MVDKIEIITNNEKILLDRKNNKSYINNNEIDFNEDNFNKLIKIMSLWNNSYINNNIIDGFKYEITVHAGSEKTSIIIKNDFPNNFDEFLEIIGNIYG